MPSIMNSSKASLEKLVKEKLNNKVEQVHALIVRLSGAYSAHLAFWRGYVSR